MLFFCLCVYEMIDNSTEIWKKAIVSVIKVHKMIMQIKYVFYYFVFLTWAKDEGWVGGGGLIYDLIDKEIKGKYGVEKWMKLQNNKLGSTK